MYLCKCRYTSTKRCLSDEPVLRHFVHIFYTVSKEDLWRVTNDLSRNDSSANKSVLCEFILPKKKDRATREDLIALQHLNTNTFIHIYIFLRVNFVKFDAVSGHNIYFSSTRNLICTSLKAQLINRSHELRSCVISLFDGDDFGIRKRNYIL